MSLTSCDITREEMGPLLTESARVVDLLYVPSGHGGGGGVGFTTGGNAVFTSVDVDIPARYAIVFQCQHGRFVIENHYALWQKLKIGEDVTITYQEVFKVNDEGRRLVDLHFVNAE